MYFGSDAKYCASALVYVIFVVKMKQQSNQKLNGKTLEMILTLLVAHYGWPAVARRMEDLYHSILASKGAKGAMP